MKYFAAFLVLVTVVASRPTTDTFDGWKRTFGKTYESDAHETSRREIWISNKAFVDEHNENHADAKFKLEMNEFADMETGEFAAIYNGLIPRSDDYSSPAIHENVTMPSAGTVDWRQKGAVTAVKNQGRCGSCWSFSATGSLEGQHFLKKGNLVSLSEQQLMDCSTKFGNHGCKGGLMDLAFEYLATVAGDDTEEIYPYKAEDGVCHYSPSNVGAGTRSHADIPRGSESGLMNALDSVGPISVAMDASHKSFQLYHSGVYTEPLCSSTKLDHGVLAIGYGTEDGEDYWLVKNSWGPDWGMEGYFEISRSNNLCGITTQASYPTEIS